MMNDHADIAFEFQRLAQRVSELISQDDGPGAFKLLEAHSRFEDLIDFQLLYCDVLLKIGRYELCQQVARQIISRDPGNLAAQNCLQMIASATVPPSRIVQQTLKRSFHTTIPQPFLGRLQDSVHHYRYRGIQMVKSPFDMALYPMLLWNLKPKTIIEIGSKEGGSALWYADLIRSFNINAKIISIDLICVLSVEDPLVTFLSGNGRDLEGVLPSGLLQDLPRPWLVIEDADHTEKTSRAVLEFFDPWLDKGDMIVIEDGIMSDLYPAAFPDYSSGPHRALKSFLHDRSTDYEIDAFYCDFFGYNTTWSSNGFLRRLTSRCLV